MSTVKIPKSKLGQLLAEAEVQQTSMKRLLSQLEEKASGRTVAKPGGWRQHPMEWWRSVKGVIATERSERN